MISKSEPVSSNTFILNNLHSSEQLSKVEVDNLIANAQAGDTAARNKVCVSYLRYIYSLAKKYARPNYPIEDLFDEGVIGLLESIKSYDPSKGSFTTHLLPWVMKHIFKVFRKESDHEAFLKELLSFDEDIVTDPYHPYISSDEGRLALDHRLLQIDLDNILTKYTDEEQTYLSSYWGLRDMEPLSIPKIAARYGVPYSRVQRTLFNLTDKLRNDQGAKALWEDYQAAA